MQSCFICIFSSLWITAELRLLKLYSFEKFDWAGWTQWVRRFVGPVAKLISEPLFFSSLPDNVYLLKSGHVDYEMKQFL